MSDTSAADCQTTSSAIHPSSDGLRNSSSSSSLSSPPPSTTFNNDDRGHSRHENNHHDHPRHRRKAHIGSRKLTIRNEPHHSLSIRKGNTDERIHFFATFAAGVGSGALASIFCAPLDLMRTRMQVWGDIDKRAAAGGAAGAGTTQSTFSGPKAAFSQILEKEGWKVGMFRGLGMTLITVPVFWGIYFPLYDQTKHYLTKRYSDEMSSGWIYMTSAVFTGAVADLICNPLFVVRTRLQTQALHQLLEEGGASHISESGIVQTTKELYNRHGLPVFWRGMTANLIGLSHCAIQFPAYEYLKETFRNRHTDGSPETALELLVASGLAKMCASLISYPHEVLRSRMMDSRAVSGPTLTGTARHIYSREGLVGFYSGLPIALVRVIPNCCVTFLSYEMILRHSEGWLRRTVSGL